MLMSCNFPMECRRWASTSSSGWLSFYSPAVSPVMALILMELLD